VSQPRILAIETSCDETAVALVRGRSELLASVIASQTKLHERYGGVVPEVASRNHLLKIRPLIDEVVSTAGGFSEVDVVAATRGPGLLTSLLVGYSVAKGLAIGLGRPFVGVNHLEGHLLSPFSEAGQGVTPCVGLIVSGGHSLLVKVDAVGSYTVLGRTLDDAAGEAFDKVAKLLGLPYPGGPVIDRLSAQGDPERFDLPRSMLGSGDLNFSFSGLKTAVRYLLPTLGGDFVADVCASFQEAVVDVLVKKTLRAAKLHRVNLVTVSGGVSLNTRLRARMQEATREAGLQLLLAPLHLTTDNAAMIAFTALERYLAGHTTDLSVDADPNLALC
jgi:tRNA N6-adenosine threonylcarbamoyltransferase